MAIKTQDIYEIAAYLVNNIETLVLDFVEAESHLAFNDYIMSRIADDLQYKYSKYDIEEAFGDAHIQILLDFYITEEDYKYYNQIH